ncbi:14706_t:CDS:1 [Acaulospora morrowiae]|uniref:14706_t:CDS:1 n=1 Tax=Acaulospora morrowiae TaxID=94023 RepID=A0A9N9D0G2_9GLOM|nr:14706_t:CDS:1 [Acaulospora morrowiae]
MVDSSELKFITKVIRHKSRLCHRRTYSSILPGPSNTFEPLKIQVIEPLHKSVKFCPPLSSSSNDEFIPTNIPSYRNSNLKNTYPLDHTNHPRRVKTHPHPHTSHSMSTLFEIKYHYFSPNPSYPPSAGYEYEGAHNHLQNRPRFRICGKEWSTRKSVTQLIFYWETVFLIGAKAARRCAGWGRTF